MRCLIFMVSFALLACNAPEPPPATGGVDLPNGPCGRGLVVVSSDYQSTNIALFDSEGNVASGSFISSASESTALSAPLSGDVVVPNARVLGEDIVLIDRFPASVLTWVDVTSGDVRAQLDVSTGFAANPRDYLELDDGRAYVTRFETNPAPGAQSFDEGGDILILDPRDPAIVGRIDLAPAMVDAPLFLPRASRMVRFDGSVYVLLLAYNADFSDAAPSRLVRIADDAIAETIVLDDLYGCEGLTTSEEGLAITCSGLLAGGATTSTVGSGLVLVERSSHAQTTTRAEGLTGQPLGFAAAFTASGVLVNALGAFGTGGGDDTLDEVLHVRDDGSFTTILESTSRPFELGDIRCTREEPGSTCGRCFVTDAETGALHHLSPEDGSLAETLVLKDGIGLPPRVLGRF